MAKISKMVLMNIVAMWLSGVNWYMGTIPARVMTGISLGFELSVFFESRFGNGAGKTLQVISALFSIEGVVFDMLHKYYLKSKKAPWLQKKMSAVLFSINFGLTFASVTSLSTNFFRNLLISSTNVSAVKISEDAAEIAGVILTVGAMICKIINLSDLLFTVVENPTPADPNEHRVVVVENPLADPEEHSGPSSPANTSPRVKVLRRFYENLDKALTQ